MFANRLTTCCGLIVAAFGALISSARGGTVPEQEDNLWPASVSHVDPQGRPSKWNAVGPFLFGKATPDGGRVTGLRPFWVQEQDKNGSLKTGYFLYPLFTYATDEETYRWNVFELIRGADVRHDAKGPISQFSNRRDFEIFPIWFSRQTGNPETSYRALFPITGTIKNRLGMERASWFAFPIHIQTEKKGVKTDTLLWPIIRVTSGEAHGFGVWPLYETRERPGRWSQQTYLWPLGYNYKASPPTDAPAGTPPTHDVGVLPFYARHTGAGVRDETYLWPFFGYSDRTQPKVYHETRYLWPFFVQGRGDNRYVNRWGPFYTHSVVKGYDKTWFAWPVLRNAHWTEQELAIEKTQLLYFLYWSEEQRSIRHPEKPKAVLTHVWPLFSRWDNGAGRKQFQLFSPFEVFFSSEKVRNAWTPFFAVAKFEQTAPGETRTSLLWNAITWRRSDTAQQREFHLGPLVSVSSQAEERRIALIRGLVAWRRSADGHWQTLWLDFPSHAAPTANQPR